MLLMTILATSFVLALSGAMMPGSLFTATISEIMRRGAMASIGYSLFFLEFAGDFIFSGIRRLDL